MRGLPGDQQEDFWATLAQQIRDHPDHDAQREADAHPLRQAPARLVRPVVYYVRFADRVKIGTTTDLKQRLATVPHDELLATEPGDRTLEAERHHQFREYRITREWFRYAGRLRDHITALS